MSFIGLFICIDIVDKILMIWKIENILQCVFDLT